MSVRYPWVELRTDNGNVYYWNQVSDVTVWELPTEEEEDEFAVGGYMEEMYDIPQDDLPPIPAETYEDEDIYGSMWKPSSQPIPQDFRQEPPGMGGGYGQKAPQSYVPKPNFGPPQTNAMPQQGFAQNNGGFAQNNGGFGQNNGGFRERGQDPRILGAKKDTPFTPNEDTKKAGSHRSIGLPTNVVRSQGLNYEDYVNYEWQSMKTPPIKSGYLERLAGMAWKRQWCILKSGCLFWFRESGDPVPVGAIDLSGATIEQDSVVQKPNAIHVFANKKHYAIAAPTPSEMNEWINSMKGVTQTPPSGLSGRNTATTIKAPSSQPLPPVQPAYNPPQQSYNPPPQQAYNPPAQQSYNQPVQQYAAQPQFGSRQQNPPQSYNASPVRTYGKSNEPIPTINPTRGPVGRSNDQLPPPREETYGASINRLPSPTMNGRPPVGGRPPPPRAQQQPPQNQMMMNPPQNQMMMNPPQNQMRGGTISGQDGRNGTMNPPPQMNYGGGGGGGKNRGDNMIGVGVTTEFKPNIKEKVSGSHDSISLPVAVVHTANFSGDDFYWAYEGSNEMKGMLEKLSGQGQWKTQWFVLRKGAINWRETQMDVTPLGTLDLKNSTVEIDTRAAKPNTLHVIGAQKQHLVISAPSYDEMQQWMTALKINGSADAEYVRKDIQTRMGEEDKRMGDEKKRRDQDFAKNEEEYIRNKEKIMAQRNMQSEVAMNLTDPVNCYCDIRFLEGKDYEGKLRFKIMMRFADQEWYIYRYDKQIIDLNANLTNGITCNITSVRNKFPKKSQGTTTMEICDQYTQYFSILVKDRASIFNDRKAGAYFTRFIAPVQLGDEKSPDFVMPFRLETL